MCWCCVTGEFGWRNRQVNHQVPNVLSFDATSDTPTPQTRALLTPHDTNNLFVGGLTLQCVVLLIVGSSVFSLLLLATMEVTCYFLFIKYIKTDINSGIIIAIGLTHLIIASFIKILLLQSLDENLATPFLTEFITFIFFITLTFAFFVVRWLPLPRLAPSPEPNLRTLEAMTAISTVMMLIPLVTGKADDADAVNGQVNFFGVAMRGFPIVAMVSSVVHALKKSNGTKVINGWSATVLGIAAVQGLASNSREGVFTPILVALITPLYYGYRPSLRKLVAVAAAVGFVTVVISPALLIVRNERTFLSFAERIERTIETAGLIIIRDPATIEATQRPLDAITYSFWGRYFGQQIPFADRVGLIQTTDVFAATANGNDYVVVGDTFGEMVKGLFPNFVLDWFGLYVERTRTSGDRIASALGITDPNAASFLAVPLDAQSFATGGIWGVIKDTFLTYGLLFYIIRLATRGGSARGILPISLLLLSHHISAECDAGQIFYYSVRVLSQFIITFYYVHLVAKIFSAGDVQVPNAV
jgi:hypothetical protein